MVARTMRIAIGISRNPSVCIDRDTLKAMMQDAGFGGGVDWQLQSDGGRWRHCAVVINSRRVECLLNPLVTAGIEGLLNTFLYRSPALKSARTLTGKSTLY